MSFDRFTEPVPRRALAASAAVIGLFLLWQQRGLTLSYDEWSFFADYRGSSLSVLASPFGGNLLAVPIAIYKVVFAAFGPGTVVFKLIVVALNLTCAALFFELARRSVPEALAAMGAGVLALLGASADVVAQSLGIAILLTSACGLGALLALERDDRMGDLLASALLAVALASNNLALPFAAGAFVTIALGGLGMLRRRAWIVAVPFAAFAAWKLWSLGVEPRGTLASHPFDFSLSELGTFPASVADSLGAAAITVTGMFSSPGTPGTFSDALAPVAATVLGIAAAVRIAWGPKLDREVAVYAAMPLVFWGLIGIAGNDRLPTSPRYLFPSAIFLMLLAAVATRGIRIGPRASAAACGVLLVGLLANVGTLNERADFYRERGRLDRAALAAIEIARDRVDPGLLIEPIGAHVDPNAPGLYSGGQIDIDADMLISAGRYLSATYAFGSPAYSPGELAAASPSARAYADRELAAALALAPVAVGEDALPLGAPGCRQEHASTAEPGQITIPVRGRGLVIRAGAGPQGQVAILAGRFGDVPAAPLAPVAAGTSALLEFPPDRSERSWTVALSFARNVVVCPLDR